MNASDFPELAFDVAAKKRKYVIPVKIARVLEPLKVRLVSAGDPLFYWTSRFMQRSLWSSMKAFKQFALTREPLSENHFHILLTDEKLTGLTKKLGEKPFWVSGDFSGATDNVEIRFTKEAFDQCLMFLKVSDGLKEILKAVLYEQMIVYPHFYVKAAGTELRQGLPDSGHDRLAPFLQTNGQLMGSTLSFPILCIVNLACYIAALEEFLGRPLTKQEFDRLAVLVNGDDILFRANNALYAIWQLKIKSAGFFLSVGKNYVHENYLMVNSQMFKCVEDLNGINQVRFEKVKWVNVGLLLAQSKGLSRNVLRDMPAEELYRQAVVDTPNPNRLAKRFVFYNLPLVQRLTSNGRFNLFIPKQLGGCGFPRPPGLDYNITPFQGRLANYLLHQLQKNYSGNAEDLIKLTEQISLVPKVQGFEIPEVFLKKRVSITARRPTDVLSQWNIHGIDKVERQFVPDRYKMIEQPLTLPVKPSVEVEIKSISKKFLKEVNSKKLPVLSKEKIEDFSPLIWVETSEEYLDQQAAAGVKKVEVEEKVDNSIKLKNLKRKPIPSPDDLLALAEQAETRPSLLISQERREELFYALDEDEDLFFEPREDVFNDKGRADVAIPLTNDSDSEPESLYDEVLPQTTFSPIFDTRNETKFKPLRPNFFGSITSVKNVMPLLKKSGNLTLS